MRKIFALFVVLTFVSAAYAQTSVQSPPITTPVVNFNATISADAACGANQYWIRPVAGATNAFRVCNNGTVTNIGGGSGGGLTGFQTVTSTIQAAFTVACAASPVLGVYIPPNYAGTDSFTNPCSTTVLDGRLLGTYRGGTVSAKDFGAGGDGGFYSGISCTSGSAVFSGVGAEVGRLPKVGDKFVATACGAAGGDVQCTLSAASGVAFGTVTCGGGVTASATVSGRGARWSATSTDDTAAVQAAINYCATRGSGGCKVKLPAPGVYFISNVLFPAISNPNVGQVAIEGDGLQASWVVGIGADHTTIFTAPVNSVPTRVAGIAFTNFDNSTKNQYGVRWLGGQLHVLENNYFVAMYQMIQAQGVQENLIQNNKCYVVRGHCLEFGAGVGGDFVTATKVLYNSFDQWGYAACCGGFHDATKHAVYTHMGDASYGNEYTGNTTQHDNPPVGEAWDVNDLYSLYTFAYFEGSSPASGYNAIIRGQNPTIINNGQTSCLDIKSLNATYFGTFIGLCPSQTWGVNNETSGFTAFGLYPEYLSLPNNNAAVFGQGMISGSGGFRVYGNGQPGTVGWPTNRVDIGLVPYSASSSTGTVPSNPTSPNQFTTGATIPSGTIVFNRYFDNTQLDGNVYWVCDNGFGVNCAFPIVATQWKRFGEMSTKIRREGTAAPTTLTWNVGDFFWNTSPSASGIVGWVCTTAGTPGTWSPVYQIDPASPPAIGATAPNTIKGTTINATVGYQVAGVALQVSNLSDGANVVTQTSNASANQICAYSGANKICVPTTTLPTAAEPAHSGDVTNSAGSLAMTIANNAVNSAKMAVVNTRRVCDIVIGDTSGSALTNAQLGPQKRMCFIPAASTVVEIDVAADGGTPNVITGVNHAGSVSNLVSAALATAAAGGIACSKTGATTGIDGATTCSGTLQNTSLAAGDYIDLVSGTAGGTAKLMTIHVVYTVN